MRVEMKALGVVTRPKARDGIPDYSRRWRRFRQHEAVRSPEPKSAV